MRAVLRSAIHSSLSDTNRWALRGDYYIPNFFPTSVAIPERVKSFWADGSLSAIHFLRLCTGPEPISPFFLRAIIIGGQMPFENLTLDFINYLDPSSAQTLLPWFLIDNSTIIEEHAHPVVQLLINYVDLPVRLICSCLDFLDLICIIFDSHCT